MSVLPMISGETRLLAVIGHPVAHSLSPRIQNYFALQSGLPYAYLAFDIPPGGTAEFARTARCLNMAGFNVTMPLKEEILTSLDEIDAKAMPFGAVNTVTLRDGRLCGSNTDGDGFWLSLQIQKRVPPVKGHALILGAGGAAKTLAITLAHKGLSVRVASRKPHNLDKFGVEACPWARINEACAGCSLLINATPLGMHGFSADFDDFSFLSALPEGALVYDLIYAPRETRLLAAAKRRGLPVANGLSHLICQAALSFYAFTGAQPPEEDIAALHSMLI